MTTRIVAALIGLAVLVPAVIWGGTLAVEIIVPLAALVCLEEYAGMAFAEDKPASLAWLVVISAVLYGTNLYLGDHWLGIAGVVVVIATMTFCVLRPGPIPQAADKCARYLLGAAWIAGCFSFMPLLRRLDHGLGWVFLLLAIAWLGDTGAFFAGKFFGRRKLYPLISPKKTWEGYFGGIILTIVGVFVLRALALPELSAVECVGVGALLGTAGVIGDLSESMLKRAFDVKDSGWIMPGHGGLLDRVDSVLFVAPLLYAFAVIVKGA